MLNFFRKNTKVIIWVVVIAFIAWGGFAASVQFEEASRSAGRLFGKRVSYRDYLAAQQAVQIFTPPPPNGAPPDTGQIEMQTWEFLVLSHEAKRRKIAVDDEVVRQEITRILGGKGDLGLTSEQYQQWIQTTFHEPAREFEDQLRDRLRIQKLVTETRQGFKENQEEAMKKWFVELFQAAKIQVYKSPPR